MRSVNKIRKVIKKNNLFASEKHAKWSHAFESQKSIENDAERAPKLIPKGKFGSPRVRKEPSQGDLGAEVEPTVKPTRQ